jgi:predicted transcriptional regulator
MTDLETLILVQAANEETVTSDSSAFSKYSHAEVCLAMWELSRAGWFEARAVQTGRGGAVAVGLVSLKTIREFSLAQES